MIHRHRTPIQRLLSNIKVALLSSCLLAVIVSAKPLSNGKGPDALQLSSNNELAPKSAAENKRDAESAAAPSNPLSPEHEQARDLWNRVKKVRHQLKPRRYIRSVARHERAVATVNGVTIPKYILELYENLTTGSATEILQQSSQANTVRSLQTVNNDPARCNIFNFSLSSINSSEYILKAELRFSLDRKQSTKKNVIVAIKSAKSTTEAVISRNDITVDNNDKHKYVFDVAGTLTQWIKDGAKYAEFGVEFFTDFSDSASPLDCSNIHFFHQNDDEETEPLLVVHSYDSEVEKIDYRTLLERLNRTTSRQTRSATDYVSNDSRDPRQSDTGIPFCDVIELNITHTEIPTKHNEERILMPSLYNAGVCGGDCGNTMPLEQDLKHNVLLHMLQASLEFRNRHGYHISRCCAPIKYSPLEVIVNPPPNGEKKNAYIRIIPNMRIEKCECLEVVDFSRSTSRRK